MMDEIEKSDLKWLESVREKGKLLEVFDLRTEDGHSKTERIEIYHTEDYELTVFIKFDNDKIIGFETY